MSSKPILAIGSKKNLLTSRGDFIFITKNKPDIFEKKINYIIKNYNHFLNVAKKNKFKFIKRNNPNVIFNQTIEKLIAL